MKEFDALVDILKTLRGPGGCKWDRAQKVDDSKSHLLEEVYELIDAIDSKDTGKVKEEIGDVIMLLVFITRLYSEKKKFSIKDALKSINEKLITRHPHVFSGKKLKNKEAIIEYWVKEKAKKKKRKTIKERLPYSAPALLLAYLYFKEKGYLNQRGDEKKLRQKISAHLRRLSGPLKKKAIVDALFTLVETAAFLKVDLECELRKKVFKNAVRERY
ncbi:MAG: hypothetical protein JXD21_02980 [Candidatus Omnitrophica bacterium]|nr:hypothetical protein [Candidatus Omnitrophota bacterium]